MFRALMLGDMLCATPALRALRGAWPQARITLVGLPWTAGLARRLDTIDDFEPFPGWPGLPERPAPTLGEMVEFMERVRAHRFDLAIQLHGSGPLTNALVANFGAARNAGFASHGVWFPPQDGARFAVWPEQGSEVLRLLGLTDHLGLARRGTQLDLPLWPGDHARARRLVPTDRAYAVVHAGAQLPSRRWPAGRFAAVADRLAQAGLRVVLTGTPGEQGLVASVAVQMGQPSLNVCGQTDLWTLGAVLSSARVLVCNDTGLSHVAAALGTRSVVVACGSETRRWAPLDTGRHQVLWQDMACRPCTYRVCPIGHACAEGLSVERVAGAALEAVTGASP